MPKYLGQDISDEQLQRLIHAYRKGYSGDDANEPADDQTCITRLEENEVTVPGDAPTAFELGQTDAGESDE